MALEQSFSRTLPTFNEVQLNKGSCLKKLNENGVLVAD